MLAACRNAAQRTVWAHRHIPLGKLLTRLGSCFKLPSLLSSAAPSSAASSSKGLSNKESSDSVEWLGWFKRRMLSNPIIGVLFVRVSKEKVCNRLSRWRPPSTGSVLW